MLAMLACGPHTRLLADIGMLNLTWGILSQASVLSQPAGCRPKPAGVCQ